MLFSLLVIDREGQMMCGAHGDLTCVGYVLFIHNGDFKPSAIFHISVTPGVAYLEFQ